MNINPAFKQIILLFFFFWLPIGIPDILSYFIYDQNSSRIFAGILLAMFLTIPALFFGKRINVYAILVFVILFILYSIFLSYLLLFHQAIIGESYYVFYETSLKETVEFMKSIFNPMIFIAIFLLWLVPLLLLKNIHGIELRKKTKIVFALVLVVFISIGMLHFHFNMNYYRKNNAALDFLLSYNGYKKEKQKLISSYMARKNAKEKNAVINTLPKEENPTFVIIIGESCSRHHMSLYEYPRVTNPLLGEIKNELLLFNNVISPYSYTILTLKTLLTFATRNDPISFYQKESIIELFNDADYDTYWISNQKALGLHETETTVIAKECKHCYFSSNDLFSLKDQYDEVLLPHIENALQNKAQKKIIFVHLMGSHEDFVNRYPKQFDFFKNAAHLNSTVASLTTEKVRTINEYDNSILYNDYIVRSVIDKVKISSPFSYVLYIPDHGEEVYDERNLFGHAGWTSSKYMFDIPFILWTSEKFGNYKEVANYQNYLKRPYCSEDAIHSILELSGLQTKDLDSTRSIFSSKYKERDEYKKW